jgi:hypothetical protein
MWKGESVGSEDGPMSGFKAPISRRVWVFPPQSEEMMRFLVNKDTPFQSKTLESFSLGIAPLVLILLSSFRIIRGLVHGCEGNSGLRLS